MDVSEPERKPEESQSSFNRRLVEWSKNMAHLEEQCENDVQSHPSSTSYKMSAAPIVNHY